jgi:hypothetical protein
MGGLRAFLDRGARKRIKRTFGALMLPGEEVVDYDMGTLDDDPTRERIDFVATERALYIFRSKSLRKGRIPYQQITEVSWEPDNPLWKNRLLWKEVGGHAYSVKMNRSPTGLAAYVKQRVSEVERPVLLERHVLVDDEGHGLTLRYQLISDTDDYAWLIDPDPGPGVEITEERNKRLGAAVKELGPEARGAYYKAHNADSSVLADRGHFAPLLLGDLQSDNFGDGIMVGLDDGYVFETDTGAAHEYPWDTVRAYRVDADTCEVVLKLQPMFGGAISMKSPRDPQVWRSLLNRQGVNETDDPSPVG